MDQALFTSQNTPDENSDINIENHSSLVFYDDLNKICFSILQFVSNEKNEPSNSYSASDCPSCCVNPMIMYNALMSQKERALGRFQCLKKLLEHLANINGSSTVSCCIRQYILESCFGFCNIILEESINPINHYLENIRAAPLEIQEKIRFVVHGIYEILIKSLKRELLKTPDNHSIILVIIFTLTSRFDAFDLSIVINNDLLQILTQLTNISTISTKPTTRIEFLSVVAFKLIQITTMCCCLHSKKVGLDTLENVLNILHEQFLKAIEIFDEYWQNVTHTRITENYTTTGERFLGDFLLFLRTISSSVIIQKLLASKKWIYTFLSLLETSNVNVSYSSQMKNLRPKLLVIQLLQTILPSLQPVHIDDDLRKHIINKLIGQISKEMWHEYSNPNPISIIENISDDAEGELFDNFKSK